MSSSLAEAVLKNLPPLFKNGAEPEVLEDPEVVKLFLRYLRVLFVCGRMPLSISEAAHILGAPAPRVGYQVKRLLECGLLQRIGTPGRGARYFAKQYWTIPHTALRATTFQDFMVDYFKQGIPVFVSACAEQMQVDKQSWHLDFDLFAPENFQIRTDGQLASGSPIISQSILRLSSEQAAELHSELTALLEKYGAGAQESHEGDGANYLLGVMLAKRA